ncbi:hypothetical protein [Streptomyces albireticuli]|uniref:Uncharacterized protein n=1 Tax=Streptomyces albireticuli TaxID=1940 RepID=A0A2A2DDI8_9ACTN|nr:hypothetical protein [Streptomyces albireticuli]MCD9144930.1 hypothetical protein [Streptomyces albireticuli]MCD9164356.1 hypothetical protein [Streptomyces albireticuli]MCD9194067.1 hypothetical protein [Streptomyces albireticuli]PAU49506.1 hypothetical protein CK936_07485 [Streptomyces albireticuli]
MATWGLVLETTVGMGDRKHAEAYVVAHVDGTREEALAELERRARRYVPEHPRSPKRRRLFRESDGFLLVIDGAWQSYSARFTIGELLDDSDAPAPAVPYEEPEPEPVEEVPVPSDARYDDGVPVKPAWLGRTDLP